MGEKTRGSIKFYAVACFPIFQKMENTGQHEIYATAGYPTQPRYLLDKVKINCFEVNYRQKTEVITRDKLYLTRPHIYLLFFQLNIWSVKCRKTYSIVI